MEARSPSKSEPQKLQRLYTQGAAAFGSVHNIVKLATYQFQRWDSFYIQNIRTQSLPLLRVNLREWSHLPDLKMTVGVWT